MAFMPISTCHMKLSSLSLAEGIAGYLHGYNQLSKDLDMFR